MTQWSGCRGGVYPLPGGRRALPYVLLLLVLTGCGQSGFRFVDLWLTADQQGQRAMDRGDYREAALRFEDPMRKGTAYYLEQDFSSALAEFAAVDTAEGWFNRGNSLAHLERYEEAVEAYVDKIGMERTNAFIEVQRDSQSPSSPGREIIGEAFPVRFSYQKIAGVHRR